MKSEAQTSRASKKRSDNSIQVAPSGHFLGYRFERLTLRARLVLFWEHLSRAALWPLILIIIYCGVSLLGVWLWLPSALTVILMIGMLTAFLFFCRDLLAVRIPSKIEALKRIEERNFLSHNPLQALEDVVGEERRDKRGKILWKAHRERILEKLHGLKTGYPNARSFVKDPYGFRVFAVLLLVVGLGGGSEDLKNALVSPFYTTLGRDEVPTRVDAWVTPPAYTQEAPIFLSGDLGKLRVEGTHIVVPQGSEVLIRSQGKREITTIFQSINGARKIIAGEVRSARIQSSNVKQRDWNFRLLESGMLQLESPKNKLYSWSFTVKSDLPPRVKFIEDPQRQLSGSTKFTYFVEDDHRVVSGVAQFEVPKSQDNEEKERRPLVKAPSFSLSVPNQNINSGVSEVYKDLTTHPWAGADVGISLVVEDDAGQEGKSQIVHFRLPQKNFNKPLARSIIEQRRTLAMDASRHVQVIDAIDSLLLAPEFFIKEAGPYLSLRFAYQKLTAAHSDEELVPLLDMLWTVALIIEGAGLSNAEQALRQAQEALREALEAGASEQKITELMQELRKALNEYLVALQEQQKLHAQQTQQSVFDPDARQVRPQDFEDMMRRMEELTKLGSFEAARELLAQMQEILENLSTEQPHSLSQQQQQTMDLLNGLENIIEDQKQLMDETHRYAQKNKSEYDLEGQESAERTEELKDKQRGVSDELQKWLDELANNGLKPNKNLNNAEDSMANAEEALGVGETRQAVGDQGDAVKDLQQGAQQLIERLLKTGSGPGAPPKSAFNSDPLGRMRRMEGSEYGSRVEIPEEVDVQRARRIQEELRRRLSNQKRSNTELEYLERLLDRY